MTFRASLILLDRNGITIPETGIFTTSVPGSTPRTICYFVGFLKVREIMEASISQADFFSSRPGLKPATP